MNRATLVTFARRDDLAGDFLETIVDLARLDEDEADATVRSAVVAFRAAGGRREQVQARVARKMKLVPLREHVETWLDAVRVGEFKGYGNGAGLTVTEKTIDDLVESINASEQPVPIDGAKISAVHEMPDDSGADSAGWVLEGAKLEDEQGRAHLWLRCVVTPEVAARLDDGRLAFGSVAFREIDLDPESGRRMARLHSYALTNKPFIPGLAPHRIRSAPGVEDLIAAADKSREEIRMSEDMKDETKSDAKPSPEDIAAAKKEGRMAALRELMGDEAKDKSDDEVEEMFRKRGEKKADEASATAPPAPPAAPAQASDEVASLRAQLAKLTEERKLAEAKDAVTAALADTRVKLSDAEHETLVELQLAGKVERVAAIIDARAKAVPPAGEAMTGRHVASDRGADSYDAAVERKLAELRKEHPAAKRHELVALANKAVAKEHPNLVPELYRASA